MEIIEKAPAKINLGLDIAGKRIDGFHELSMVMISVDLNDYLTFTELEEDRVIVESSSHKLPLNSKNDVYKAAKMIKERYGIKRGIRIVLEKSIPICAGLGGGSSDAAATLRALNRLWKLNISKKDLIAIGFKIGSDVPYCLEGGCALVSGKGEIVDCLTNSFSLWVVLVKPNFGISTRTIFKEINTETITRVDIAALKKAIISDDYEGMLNNMGNSLEDITIVKRPIINKIKDRMVKCGADIALMTGSGPTVFALCPTEKRADRVVNSMKGFCKEVYKVRML
ncbi:4-(cytidine 5'-diphospho)-2-C-methyl-D-erythritol kinase [Streptococcus macacae]|uniref:Putative 4-diphosphocytidyl-2-C-methyl-D-erythritol kinase n=1 Tax=Streptococcus macacae NCTC 11558 TaxID=764298 RepID=G5JW98_9STRE|nr:4-(cytidine 5'-diphospho)-2-C-methyl-D-erythritol kinase [Streptococcus macacae]EHJ52153.1 4-(cytidine 5'-diphospho)-2-C-methyl-D-erythritol kinase [Streptococcus macacae NCTC 11558]SUN77753.1 4-diphosphocytidyl-2-C-methyl-D-erythritol kinase [Streptococcus macacae NCTC 11558]